MESQLAYLKSVIEGAADIEPWKNWFSANDAALQNGLTRTRYLDLKLHRIKAIPRILTAHGISFVPSDRYAYLGGVEGRCRECGAILERSPKFKEAGGMLWCPKGCFRMHVLRRPPSPR